MRAFDNIFGDNINSFAASFVDDFCIFDSKFEDHLVHLDYVLGELAKHGLTVKPSKVHFCKKEVEFLGIIVSENGIRPNPIKEIPPPKNVRQIRRVLGICQYQARFLINYAKEVQPLRELLKEENKWTWMAWEESAFNRVKALFVESVKLQRPDYDRPFIIYNGWILFWRRRGVIKGRR